MEQKDEHYEQDEELDEEPNVESLNFNEPDFTFAPQERHNWVQRGYYLVCTSCDGVEHGTWVGPHKIMVGISEETGKPLLKYRAELGLA